ncbi:hypothetical protein [Rhizocola hellebori]|uniref:hypothetical protein n=1 Tax=Rhizocola hellebori TaxID=1392758 RepID=UPI0019445358|nr:hypothetical protein [Rhizocola hellebori]
MLRRVSIDLGQVQEHTRSRLVAKPSAYWPTVLNEELGGLLAQLATDLELCYQRIRDKALATALRCPPDVATIQLVDAAVRRETQRHPGSAPEVAQATLELTIWSLVFADDAEEGDVDQRITRAVDGVAALMLDHVLERFDAMYRCLETAIISFAK